MAKVFAIKEYAGERANSAINFQANSRAQEKSAVSSLAIEHRNLPQFNQLGLYNVCNISFGRSDSQKIKPGCNYNEKTQTLEFGVASEHAQRIELYIFDKPVDGKIIKKIVMEQHGSKWIAKLAKHTQKALHLDIEGEKGHKTPVYYGYRAWGPNWEYDKDWKPGSKEGFKSHVDNQGNRYNPNKLLIDPYAKEISHDPVSPDAQGISPDGSFYATGHENYLKDSAALAPKGVFILADGKDIGEKPRRALKDDVIYEVHLRGFTKLDESIPEEYRGTYKGAAMKAKYLKEMGITMVEFLPVQEFDDDKNDYQGAKINDKNYWGYGTINFFSPNRRFAYDKSPGGPTKEFREMVKAFHDEGLKVCIDVVYNHSAEGGVWKKDGKELPDVSNIYSMRGFDNSAYYNLAPDKRFFWNDNGCGADMNVQNPIARNMVADSIKYWANEMGVDSFRFDLAPILANASEKTGFHFDPKKADGLVKKLEHDLNVRYNDANGDVDLIAEPWTAAGNYIGGFPRKWKEWNAKFRDTVRDMFNRQEQTSFKDIAFVLSGSDWLFRGKNTRSINFVTCHDGFTMKDLFSNNGPNNIQPDGFSSDGGTSDNHSWDNFNDFSRQIRAMRNAFLTMMVAKGTPMVYGGDEIIRTLDGNNNPYNLDDDKNYLHWNLNESQKNMQEFTKRAILFRKAHKALRNSEYYKGQDKNNNGLKDVTWLTDKAKEADGAYLDASCNNFLGFRIDGTEFGDTAASIYTVMNKGDGSIEMKLPKNLPGKQWYLAADTSEHSEIKGNFAKNGSEILIEDENYEASPRSMMVFIEK